MATQLKIKAEGAVISHYWMVPVESVVVDQRNNNRYGAYQEEDLRDLLEDLDNQKGIETPVICRPLPDYQPLLVEGYRRHAAVTLWNSRHKPSEAVKLPVMLKEMNDDEALEANVAENVKRRSLTPMDVAVGIRNLTNNGRSDEEIAHIYQKSPAWISRQRLLLRLDKHLRGRVHSGDILGTSAIELAELEDEKRGIVVTTIERDYNGKFSVTNIRKVGREIGGFGDGVTPQPVQVREFTEEDECDGRVEMPQRSKGHTPRRKQRTLKELNDYFDRWDMNMRLTQIGRDYIRLHIGLLSGKVSDEDMDRAIVTLFAAE